MTASPASVKTSRWAKFLLFGSTMLFAYSLLVLLAAHAHHDHHHEHGEHHHHRADHHPPHDPRHFGDRHSHSLVAAGEAAEAEEGPHGRGTGIHHHREEPAQRDGGAPPINKQGEPEEEEGGHHHHHNHHHDGHRQHQHHHDDSPLRKEEGPHSDGSLVKSEGHQRDEPHNSNGEASEATKKHSHKQHKHPRVNHEALVEGEEGKKKENGALLRKEGPPRRKEEGHSDDDAVPKGGISHHQEEKDRDHPHEQYKGPHAHDGRGGHRQNDGPRQRPHPHQQMMAPVHHVAGLAMITALTGIAASFTQRRGLATLFIVVLLVTELAALGAVSHGAKKAVEMCHLKNQQIRVEQTLVIARGPNAIAVGTLDRYSVTQDKAGEEDCIKRVHHHIGLGSLMIGVICTALACCGSRMGRAIVEEEVESAKMREAYAASHQQRNIIQVAVVVPASAEEDSSALNNDEEDPYNGHEDSEKTVLITRA